MSRPIIGIYIGTDEGAEKYAKAAANSAGRAVLLQLPEGRSGGYMVSHYREKGYRLVHVIEPDHVSLMDRFKAAWAAFRMV